MKPIGFKEKIFFGKTESMVKRIVLALSYIIPSAASIKPFTSKIIRGEVKALVE